ncbi:hypothetical protein [uncultured Sphingobacterium sp.]|uniref:hypothetical protein n=1 Tax=uncultured Sphingobacterium sp. TaxID=182688 RepID=UPI0025DBEFDE|nr:hypothetical protein [uncultured Sphingobacterium sp.]
MHRIFLRISAYNERKRKFYEGGQQGGNGQQGCTIVWESRPVFIVYAGGVDLIYVPVCH